jgi:hypothetical protein
MKFSVFFCSLQGGSSAPRNAYPGAAPPHIKGTPRPSGPAMTSPAGAISSAPYRGAGWTQGYAPAQQTYRYSAPIAAQPAYAYTQHTTTTVSVDLGFGQINQSFQIDLLDDINKERFPVSRGISLRLIATFLKISFQFSEIFSIFSMMIFGILPNNFAADVSCIAT